MYQAADGTIRIGYAPVGGEEQNREGETRIDHMGFDLHCRMKDVLQMDVILPIGEMDLVLMPDQVTWNAVYRGKRYRLVEIPDGARETETKTGPQPRLAETPEPNFRMP